MQILKGIKKGLKRRKGQNVSAVITMIHKYKNMGLELIHGRNNGLNTPPTSDTAIKAPTQICVCNTTLDGGVHEPCQWANINKPRQNREGTQT